MEKQKKKESKKVVKKKVGRPKGSKNKNSKNTRLKGTFRVVSYFIKIILKVIKLPNLRYFVYDGAFGNNAGIQATRKAGLHLISKLKKNSALYFKCTQKRKGRGRPTIYGEKVDVSLLPEKYLKDTKIDKDIETKFYQFEALNKTISGSLNIVIIYSKNLKTKKETHTILFSTDLKQEFQQIIDYYSLRFQIEFNFRDAKQFFGLEDFMNVKKRRIHNFANLSMFMNSLSYLVHKKSGFSHYSVNDLKSIFIAERYTREVLKLYGQKVDDILINEAITKVSSFSLIHQSSA
jgi:putative transposase